MPERETDFEKELRARIAAAKAAGDDEEEHVSIDLLVSAFIVGKKNAAEAAALAAALVKRSPDATHLRMLARAKELLGDQKEADQLFRKADRTPDEHIDAASESLLKSMLEKS